MIRALDCQWLKPQGPKSNLFSCFLESRPQVLEPWKKSLSVHNCTENLMFSNFFVKQSGHFQCNTKRPSYSHKSSDYLTVNIDAQITTLTIIKAQIDSNRGSNFFRKALRLGAQYLETSAKLPKTLWAITQKFWSKTIVAQMCSKATTFSLRSL